jgi:hypothetical protein
MLLILRTTVSISMFSFGGLYGLNVGWKPAAE